MDLPKVEIDLSHFGTNEHSIIGMISHLGPQMGVADGIALNNLISNNKKITAVFSGEGGTSEGDFHEAKCCFCMEFACNFYYRK